MCVFKYNQVNRKCDFAPLSVSTLLHLHDKADLMKELESLALLRNLMQHFEFKSLFQCIFCLKSFHSERFYFKN